MDIDPDSTGGSYSSKWMDASAMPQQTRSSPGSAAISQLWRSQICWTVRCGGHHFKDELIRTDPKPWAPFSSQFKTLTESN